MNSETRYVINILISMIPIGIVGVFFKDEVEAIFGSGLLIVGCMLLLTAALLSFSYYAKPLIVGFIAAFVSGCLACKWMINIVKKGKLIYFAIYCAIVGVVTIVVSQLQ